MNEFKNDLVKGIGLIALTAATTATAYITLKICTNVYGPITFGVTPMVKEK
jgi:hypothetical protein